MLEAVIWVWGSSCSWTSEVTNWMIGPIWRCVSGENVPGFGGVYGCRASPA